MQADYAVKNPSSWRTRLMAIAFGAFHVLRSLARERLRVSCGLRGNGMCFTSRVLTLVPHDAFSIVEDVEYGIRLGQAGYRVHYAAEAHVYGEMVSSSRASASQRQRWERGRAALAMTHGLPLLLGGIRKRDAVLLDLAADVLVPPLGTLAALVVVGLAAAWGSGRLLGQHVPLQIWIANLIALVLYVLRGWSLSRHRRARAARSRMRSGLRRVEGLATSDATEPPGELGAHRARSRAPADRAVNGCYGCISANFNRSRAEACFSFARRCSRRSPW